MRLPHFKWNITSGLIILALLAHVGLAVFAIKTRVVISPIQDPLEYRTLAQNLLSHGVFSTNTSPPYLHELLRTPGYPLFLALLLGIFHWPYSITIAQLMLHLLIGIGILAVLRNKTRPWIAALAVACWLFDPLSLSLSLITMSEMLFAALIMLIVWLMTRRDDRRFFIGLLIGAAILVRPSGVTYVLGPIAYDLLRFKKYLVRSIALFLLGTGLVLAPWLYRNHVLIGSYTLSSSGAYNFDGAFGDDATHAQIQKAEQSSPILLDAKGRPGRSYQTFTTAAYPELKTLESRTIERVGLTHILLIDISCAPEMWSSPFFGLPAAWLGPLGPYRSALIDLSDLFILLLGFLCCGATTLLWDQERRPLVACCLVLLLVPTVGNLCISYPRMAVPLYPIVCILVALGADTILNWSHKKKTEQTTMT